MTAGRGILLAMLAGFLALTISAAPAAARSGKAANDGVTHVYFVRGFLNVFSTGFDEMAAQLQAKGIKARVYGHLSGSQIRRDILAESKRVGGKLQPIVIVGHSFGANAALAVSAMLGQQGIPVARVITIDPTHAGPLSPTVRRYENYYFPGNGLGHKLTSKTLGGRITNIDLSAKSWVKASGDGHFSVTTNAGFEAEILGRVMAGLK